MGKVRTKGRVGYADRALNYARQIVSGNVPAGALVRAAARRAIDDRSRDGFRWHFDRERAELPCEFIETLPHIKGKWGSPTITLEDWQCFIICEIFGWIDAAGIRRYRKALIVLPRKNAKSTMAAGMALFCLIADGEPGAEVYSAATTRDQAKICWDIARNQVLRSSEMQEALGVSPLAHSIVVESTASSYKPLSRDADSLEGLNPHCAVIDELHAHGTRDVYDVLDEATGARRQPLLIIISTEGDNAEGVFAEQVDYLKTILGGEHRDDSYFGIHYSIDAEDDWTSPAAWRKANPNLGVSVFDADMETRCAQAKMNPASQASFLTKRLNVRVGASEAYFSMLAWDSICLDKTLKIEDFKNDPCIITLDLASKWDLTAKVYVFRRGAKYFVFSRCYLPDGALEKGKPNYDVYTGWARSGKLTVVPNSPIMDYDFVELELLEDMREYKPKKIGYDPYNATQFVTNMGKHNAPMIEVPATVLQFSDSMKEIEARIRDGKIVHNGDPVLRWAMGNVSAKTDAKENVFPRKARDANKIDPAVALIMAANLWAREGPQQAWGYKVYGV